MIKLEGSFEVHEKGAGYKELEGYVNRLPPGDYNFVIYDNKKNRSLPQLKYLFGVVLKTISEKLPNHPPVNALYRYFEEIYAPIHVCNLPGLANYEYFDLKSEPTIELNNVIDNIIQHARNEFNISIPERNTLKLPEAKEAYVGAYTEMWRKFPLNQ